MLNALRTSVKQSPYLKWILGGVGLGLVAYLGNYFVGNGSGPGTTAWIARVNDAQILESEFRQMARRLDTQYRNMFGDSYEQLKPQLQIRRRALNTLVEKELILQDARRIGLRTSAADLAQLIRNHPDLQDANGQFIGAERYKRVIARYPGGATAFERMLGNDLLIDQWMALVTQPLTIGDDELQEVFRDRTEKTAIDYVFVAAADQQIEREIGDDELRRWYDEHLDDYMRDAGWNIRYIVVDRESQLEQIEPSDDEIREYYDANQANYTNPEQRRARHILFRLDPAAVEADKQAARQRAEGALERLRAGEDFGALARELSEDTVSAERGGDLDLFGRGQMVEPFEQAVFDTPVGEYAPITETPFGLHVIEVTDSRPEGVSPLDDVEEDIRRLVRLRQVEARISAEAQRLRDAMGSAERLEQVAAEEELTVASAFFSDSDAPQELGALPSFKEAVAQLGTGELSQPLAVASGVALVVVDEALPAAPAPLEDVQTAVSAAILDDLKGAAALEAARRSYERHDDVAGVARALGLEQQSSGDLAPGQAPPGTGGSTAELEQALFGDGVGGGERGVAVVTDGALVYEISRREPFDPARFAAEKASLRQEILQNRRSQYSQSLINQLKLQERVEYNPLWLEALDQT